MKHSKAGIFCMIFGIVLICAALLLLLHNQMENIAAGENTRQTMSQLREEIKAQLQTRPETPVFPLLPENHVDPYDEEAVEASYEMKEVEINGNAYVGDLSIPTLGLELPILSECSEALLKIAPCRQFGSSKSGDLVIAGHNYRSHFGSLSKLCIADLVQFTDMDGLTTTYSVENVSVISPDAVDAVENSEWDLVLYTCTYDSQNRVMVGCLAIQ